MTKKQNETSEQNNTYEWFIDNELTAEAMFEHISFNGFIDQISFGSTGTFTWLSNHWNDNDLLV